MFDTMELVRDGGMVVVPTKDRLKLGDGEGGCHAQT